MGFLLRLNVFCEHRQTKCDDSLRKSICFLFMRAFLFWIVPCGGGCSDSRSASIITCAMCSCSSISTDKPAGQIHAIPTSVWFGSLLSKAFYLLSKSTAAALLKTERGFLSFPSCWNPHEIIGAEVVKCVFSLQVIQIKLSRPVMYRLLHTEFFLLGNWSQLQDPLSLE